MARLGLERRQKKRMSCVQGDVKMSSEAAFLFALFTCGMCGWRTKWGRSGRKNVVNRTAEIITISLPLAIM